MSDPQPIISVVPPEAPIPSERWVELPSGDTLHIDTVNDGRVEGHRMLPTGKKLRFTGRLEDWMAIVARYGGL